MARLELSSLSSLALEGSSDSFDLVFDVSSKPLPAFSAIDCWRGRSISPLRDRVMIEWLCSHYEAEILLESMISEINETIKKWRATVTDLSASPSSECQTSAPPTSQLLVAVACQTGAQHSVCFVEKLYEKYSLESPIELEGDVRVEVMRQHSEVTKGEWLNTTDAIWQHSRFPVRHLLNRRDLVMNRMWSNFPLESTRLVEAEFRQDPFSKNLDIGKNIINFERGVLLNKKSLEEFRIRSTVPRLEGRVQSSWFEDDEYKVFHKSYSSAGILFYSVHPLTGEAVFLLGHMTYSTMSWCDFGGIRNFGEKARYTAARECYEETLGILGKTKHLVSMLENYEENNVFKIVNKDTRYVGHFVRIPYKDYPTVFEGALLTATDIVEVDEMRWFSLSCLRHGIHKALLDQYDLKVEPLNEDGSVDFCQDPLLLRLELVHSLCIAEQLGVLESIKHIAKEIHERDQPPSPPYVSYPQPRQRIVKTSYTESANQETICSRDSLKDSTSIAAKVKHCSDNEEESHDTEALPLNESSITKSLYVEAIDVAVSSSSLGREGLRRRRKDKTNESSLRNAKSIKKGITASKEKQEAAAVGVCDFCSIAASSVQCSHEIHVRRGLWQKWKDFNDHFDYYIYRVNFHSVICIQRQDTKAALAIDLVVNHITKKWYIRVREVEWKPGNWTVHRSKYTWHAAAALKAVQSYTVDFNKWNITNNCGTFVKGVIKRMANAEKRAGYECEPITDDFDKLSSFAAESLGVEVTYLTRKEAVEPIPPQEEGEEEDINNGPIYQKDYVDKSDTAHAIGENNSNDAVDNGTAHMDEETMDVGINGVRPNVLQMEKKDNESLKMIEKANNE